MFGVPTPKGFLHALWIQDVNRTTSLYLDLVRFVAALLVFITHFSTTWGSGGLLWQLQPLGSDAVVVFFVLSGFVIAHATARPNATGRDYTVSRVARMYSVCVPALILTYGLEALNLDSPIEASACGLCLGPAHFAGQVLDAALFTGQLWFRHVPAGANTPYWSLGYEVPYYVFFGLVTFVRRWPGWLLAAVAVLTMGPNVASLLPLWLLGAGCYRLIIRFPVGTSTGLVLWLATTVVLAALLLPPTPHHQLYDDVSLDPQRLHDLLRVYVIGVLFALHVIATQAAARVLAPGLERMAGAIRWCGRRTFALYLFHVPLIHLAVGLAPWSETAWATRALVFFGVPALALTLAGMTELRRIAWRQGLEMISPKSQ